MNDTFSKDLSQLLDRASRGKADDIRVFFGALLESKVYVPLKPEEGIEPEIGQNTNTVLGYVSIQQDGKLIFPIFTKESFVNGWAEAEIKAKKVEFKTFLLGLGEKDWAYLDPSQEVGKELSPWEIQRLKSGNDAIDEIVFELAELDHDELEVDLTSLQYEDLKKQLIPVLEIYPEIKEAFLISMNKEGRMIPLLGILQDGLAKDKLEYIWDELKEVARAHLEDGIDLVLADDLSEETSANRKLFSEVNPFYVAQEKVENKKAANILDSLKSFFVKK